MTTDKLPRYVNYEHYITEGWSKEPKFTFLRVCDAAKSLRLSSANVLDIGCATGEFIAYMESEFPEWKFTGLDIFADLIEKARAFLPKQTFVNCDYLSLDSSYDNTFDVITAIGVISLFSGDDLDAFWSKSAQLLKPGGSIIVLGPVNEFGVDMDLKHRKWVDGERRGWERGWSIPSRQSIELSVKEYFETYNFSPYEPQLDLEPKADPIRTWTVSYKGKKRQLTNGLKLLVDYNLILATTP